MSERSLNTHPSIKPPEQPKLVQDPISQDDDKRRELESAYHSSRLTAAQELVVKGVLEADFLDKLLPESSK